MIKKITLIGSIFTGIFLILIFGSLFFLETVPGQVLLEKKINAKIPGSLSWQKLNLSLLTGTIDLQHFQLKDPDRKNVAGFKRLKINIKWLKLLKGKIVLSSILLESPSVTLETGIDGSINLISALVESGPDPKEENRPSNSLPFNILVDNFQLKNGVLQFQMPEKKMAASFDGLEILIKNFDLVQKKADLNVMIDKGYVQSSKVFYDFEQFKTDAVLADGTLSPFLLDLISDGVNMKIHGSIKNIFKDPELAVTLDSKISLSWLNQFFKPEQKSDGILALDLSVKGRLADPLCELSVQYGGGTVYGQTIDKLNLVLNLRDRIASILPSSFESRAGDLFFNGEANFQKAFPKGFLNSSRDFDKISYTLKITQDQTKISRILPDGIIVTDGWMESYINLSGEGSDPKKIVAEMAIDLKAKAVKVNSLPDSFGSPEALTELNGIFMGDLDLKASLTGNMKNPRVSITFLSKEIGIDDTLIGDVSANIDFSNGTVLVKELKLVNKNSGLDLDGSIKIMEPETQKILTTPYLDIRVVAKSIFLEDFLDEMQGQISINGFIKGIPENLTGNLDIEGNMIDLNIQKIEKFTFKTLLDGQKITIEKIDIDITQGASIKGKGWVSAKKNNFEINLFSNNFPLSAIYLLTQKELTNGFFDMNLSGNGTFDNPLINSSINIKDLMISEKKLDDINLDLDLKDKMIKIKGNAGFMFAGEYRIDNQDFEATLDLDSVDLSPYFKMAGKNDFSGKIHGVAAAGGNLHDPEMIKATLDLEKLTIFFKEKEFVKLQPTSLSFEKGFFIIPETKINLFEKGMVTIIGQGSLKEDIDFQINGNIPFEVINPVLKNVDQVTGNINLSATIKGTIQKPLINADLKLNQLGMSLSLIEQELKQVNGHIKISPDEIQILEFYGFLDDGKFDIKGRAELEEFLPQNYTVSFNAQQLAMDFPDLMDITINSQLNLNGTKDSSSLTGEIVLLEGRYYKDIVLDLAGAAKKRRENQPAKEKKDESFLDHISLNINISRREPFWVDNNLAYLSVSPDLSISGTASHPLVGGRASVDSGIITFQKNEFEINKGIIDFVNPYKIEPTLDIEGEVEIRAWTVYLTISGTPDNLDFNFSSKPAEQHADIISLLAFGKTTRELRQAGGGSNFSSGEILAGFVAQTLEKSLKDASGMDYFEIDMDDIDSSGAQGINVTVGKELSRQITVKYGVDVRNGETIQRVTTDYKILENFLMSGFQDTGGDFGGELKYRLEFR